MAVLMDNSSRAGHHQEFEAVAEVLGEVRDRLDANTQALTAFQNAVGSKLDTVSLRIGGLETPITGTNTLLGQMRTTIETVQTGLGQVRTSIETVHTALRQTLTQQLGALQTSTDGLATCLSSEAATFSTQMQESVGQIRGELAALQTAIQTSQQPLPQWMEDKLQAIGTTLTAMKDTFEASHQASEAIRAQAEAAIAANQQQVAAYLQNVNPPSEEPAPVDPYPFESLPDGTTVRELPDGGRLFSLANGDVIRVSADGVIAFIGADGESQALNPALGRDVTLPNGAILRLDPTAVLVTHEAAMITGLPVDVEPERVGEGRFLAPIAENAFLTVNHQDRTATLFHLAGTTVLLSYPRIEAFGEGVEVGILPSGMKNFATEESGHRGVVEIDGTIRLATANGLDLVIRFPEPAPPVDEQETRPICEGECRREDA
ncbi:MAG TPA: hypothetical protein PLO37_06460 [Candidatus Hydrogenedentes bacterium]|nr:hypothetical protein [Candidatus Hydrogenedentota bacterium]HPG66473.1 hypothetical protein [Candidatus Hydrogenedentota bacterium]